MHALYIAIHHSISKDEPDGMSWDAIKKYHTEVRGWNDVGYHFGIERIDGEYQMLAGRPLNENGAHVLGFNHNAIGVLLVGNFNKNLPDEEMLDFAAKHVAGLCVALGLEAQDVKGHKELDTRRSCPGELINMYAFRARVSLFMKQE